MLSIHNIYCDGHCTFSTVVCILIKGWQCEQCGKWQRARVCHLSLIGLNIEWGVGGGWVGWGGWQADTCSIACIDCILGLQFSELRGSCSALPRLTEGKKATGKSLLSVCKCCCCCSWRCADWILSLTQSSQSGPVWVLWWFITLKETRLTGPVDYWAAPPHTSTAGRSRCKASGSFTAARTSFWLFSFLTAAV